MSESGSKPAGREVLVNVFKDAWHAADERGEEGKRVEAGIEAVLREIGYGWVPETTGTDTEPLDLDAIEARADAATRAPWSVIVSNSKATAIGYSPLGGLLREVDPNEITVGTVMRGQNLHDLAFVMHAREDIPALIAEVRRLREGHASTSEYRVTYEDGQFDQFDSARDAQKWAERFDGMIVFRTITSFTSEWTPYNAGVTA